MSKPIELDQLETGLRTHCSYPSLGECELITARGPVKVVEVPGILSIAVDRDGISSIALLVYEPSRELDGKGTGLIAQMSPDNARNLAASLVHLANRADGGVVQ